MAQSSISLQPLILDSLKTRMIPSNNGTSIASLLMLYGLSGISSLILLSPVFLQAQLQAMGSIPPRPLLQKLLLKPPGTKTDILNNLNMSKPGNQNGSFGTHSDLAIQIPQVKISSKSPLVNMILY